MSAVEWVRGMRDDGYVFVCCGEARDVDAYEIRKDCGHGDDTEQLIHILTSRDAACGAPAGEVVQ